MFLLLVRCDKNGFLCNKRGFLTKFYTYPVSMKLTFNMFDTGTTLRELSQQYDKLFDLTGVRSATENVLPANLRAALSLHSSNRILLLQGPVGPFFHRLEKYLAVRNLDVWRVCFNAGDLLYSKSGKRLTFVAGEDEWESWLQSILSSGRFDCIVLFGSERPAHRIARSLAKNNNVNVVSLEEGYIRPGFVTVEDSGNNSSSPLAGQMPEPDFDPVVMPTSAKTYRSWLQMTFYGAAYYTIRGIFGFGRQRELFHRKAPLVSETFFWIRNAFRRVLYAEKNYKAIQSLLENYGGQYYLVPLQVSADVNIQRFSSGWNSMKLISTSIKSFAEFAPQRTRLVFKIHPMERGHNSLTPLIKSTAAAFGIEDRVDVVDTGSLGVLARYSAGMITINSSSGLSAIFHGVPLMVLGRAIYANSTLATCGRTATDFDEFWRSHHVADDTTRKSYISWIKHQALKPGDFYAGEGMEAACQSVFEKINNNSTSAKSAEPKMSATR